MSEVIPSLINDVVAAPNIDDPKYLSDLLLGTESKEIAMLLESLPRDQRFDVWSSVQITKKLSVLLMLRGDVRDSLVQVTDDQEWEAVLSEAAADDLLELSDSLPERLIDRALDAMDNKQKQYFKDASQYANDQIGHWLTHDMLVLPTNARVRDGLRLIRREIPHHTDTIFLVNRAGQFSEAVKITRLFAAPEHIHLVDIAEESIEIVKAEEDATKSAMIVQQSDFASLPVIGENTELLGRLDMTTACELVNEFYERQLMATAGMDEEEDLFAPVKKSAKNRAVWLGINLLTAFLASWFIGLFEATLQQVVALAVLMPVVASMGGIAGSQTLTLIIRGLALGQVSSANFRALLIKEISVGTLNGVIWAFVIGIVASMWFDSPLLGFVICLAIFVNIIAAAFAGVIVPVILDKLKIDPALSGSVVLTTVTDIVGFVSFLGLGSLLLI